MSSMLKQAVVDAEALREAAQKSAEAALIEKYSNKIKEAVDIMLEQPEDEEEEDALEMGDLETLSDEEGEVEGESGVVDDLPLAATDGEQLCSCPDDEEEIEIDFGELEKQMAGEGDLDSGEMMDREKIADELLDNDEEEMDIPVMEEAEDKPLEEKEEIDEEVELDEENLEKMLEELTVDIETVPTGWTETPTADIERAVDYELAKRISDTEGKEESEELAKAMEKLKEDLNLEKNKNKSLLQEKNSLSNKINQYKELFIKLKDKAEKINLVNAHLLYTNRVITNTSLNERQKTQLVEAIQKTPSVEKAKEVFETLKSAVGSTQRRKAPESLSEASIPSNRVLAVSRKRETQPSVSPEAERWKKLAGIK